MKNEKLRMENGKWKMENGKWRRAAAQFFLLAKHVSQLGWLTKLTFWETSVSLVRDPTACLPAMAAAVRKEYYNDVLRALAHHPLPGVLPAEAVPWFNNLVKAWETHRTSSSGYYQNLARLALVRLDGCSPPDGQERPSRLAEWLKEARKIANGKWQMENGKWKMENGKWKMENGKWKMENGKWKMKNGK